MNTYTPVRVGVVGATGYSGMELLRRLARHPYVDLRAAMGSATSEAKRLPSLRKIWDAPVEKLDVERLVKDTDAVFLAVPDTLSAEVGPALARRGSARVRHLGGVPPAHRRERQRWYPHSPKPDVPVTYGLTERYREALRDGIARRLRGLLSDRGDPGAAAARGGRTAAAGRRHRREVRDLRRRQDAHRAHAFLRGPRQHVGLRGVLAPAWRRNSSRSSAWTVTFVPHLVPLDRGILETIYARLQPGVDAAAIETVLHDAYADSPFVRLTGSDLPEIKHVAHTNFCDIGWRVDRPGGQLVLVSCIDNLVKGAAGQAIQNFNVAFGFDETAGVELTWRRSSSSAASCSRTRRRCGPRRKRSSALAAGGPLVVVHGGGRAIDAELRAARRIAAVRRRPSRHRRRRARHRRRRCLPAGPTPRFVAAIGAAGGRAVGLTGADGAIGLARRAAPLKTVAGELRRPRTRRRTRWHRRGAAGRPAADRLHPGRRQHRRRWRGRAAERQRRRPRGAPRDDAAGRRG